MSQNTTHYLGEFLEYLEIEKGRSVHTITMYERYIKAYFEYAQITRVQDITAESVRSFRIALNRSPTREGTMKKTTQNKYLIALRSFLKYLAKRDISTLEASKIELAQTAQRELDVITRDEFNRLMSAPSGSDLEDIRDKAILEFLYSTGLRVSELCSLKEDIDLSRDELTIRGKGEKLRLVFISQAARRATRAYLDLRHQADLPILSPALFVMKTGSAIYPRAVQRILNKRAREAGIMRRVTPHDLRHYFATDLLHNGADIRSVQMLLGHASINTTQVYTKLSDKFLKEVHSKYHGNT
ncbi:MAG: site-specific tyrosine recombinase/integron integrase [Patescibacteria group bacterium]